MGSDRFVRAMLALIAAALLVLTVHEVGWWPGSTTSAAGSPPFSPARYRLVPVPMARTLLLLDTRDGRVWRAPLPNPTAWREVRRPKASPAPPAEKPSRP